LAFNGATDSVTAGYVQVTINEDISVDVGNTVNDIMPAIISIALLEAIVAVFKKLQG